MSGPDTTPTEEETDDAPADATTEAQTATDAEASGDGEAAGTSDASGKEIGGRGGPDPTRYGDWEINGRCVDF